MHDAIARLPALLRREAARAGGAAFVACLALPLALLHARALAEILIACIDVLFLGHSLLTRRSSWLHSGFSRAAGLWWLWLCLCSAMSGAGLLLAVLAIRLPVLAVALGDWVLAGADVSQRRRRQAVWLAVAASAGWIALESWQQYLTGTNLFGDARWSDGALTGPFFKPRAGPAFILVFFPALLPPVMRLLAWPGWRPRAGGVALAVAAVLTMVLIGQRMPTLLMMFGLGVCALLIPRLRLALCAAAGAGLALLAATPWVSPATYAKLVGETSDQLGHFAQSAYGLVFVRAVTVGELRPWLGQGFDGFRRRCSLPSVMHGVRWLGVPDDQSGGLLACNIHPHNYYLEAFDNAGLPGLVLFAAMAWLALAPLARGLRREAAPPRLGCFLGVLVALWPIASTSAFTSMPNGGWVFLVLGLGFSLAPRMRERGKPIPVQIDLTKAGHPT